MAIATLVIFDQTKLGLLRADVERRARKSGLHGHAAWRFFRAEPQNRTLAWHRLAEAARWNLPRVLCRRLYLRSSRRSGLEILAPDLGGGVILPHWGRIILNAASIGADLYAFHNVTVGHDYTRGRPRIGNDVFLGAGSVVLGDITVGDHVMVAAGTVVVGDVPSCTVVAGNPARIVRNIEAGEISRMIGY